MASSRTYYFYLMASASGVLYAGVTNNVQRRVSEHKQKKVPGFSARYNVKNLVYFEMFGDIRAAIRREKQVKGWLRKKKIALIQSMNPQWKDLSADWLPAASGGLPWRSAGEAKIALDANKRDSSLRSE